MPTEKEVFEGFLSEADHAFRLASLHRPILFERLLQHRHLTPCKRAALAVLWVACGGCLGILVPTEVLDFGCGDGRYLQPTSWHFRELTHVSRVAVP